MSNPLIEVKGLNKSFPIVKGVFVRQHIGEVVATNNVSFSIYEREVLGFVGESGSGKSTIGRLVLGLVSTDSGEVRFDGSPINNLSKRRLKPFRREMQMVFQDPLSSLNPRRTAAENIARPLLNFGTKRAEIADRISQLLEMVGLERQHANRFPHEFSGGQCQRICIARALALEPRFLFLDEAVSALDVSIQAQILNLLKDIKESLNLTYLFVSHDLKVVSYIADRIVVLYQGSIAESGPSQEIYNNPQHPYTKELLASVLNIDEQSNSTGQQSSRALDSVDGTPDADLRTASISKGGCAYARICLQQQPECTTITPEPVEVGLNHFVSCHLFDSSKQITSNARHVASAQFHK